MNSIEIINKIEDLKVRECNEQYLKNPKTIQDKLRYLAITDLSQLKINCADKLLVKDYIFKKTGKKLFANVLYSFNNINELTEKQFKSLPKKFVVKGNQGWHMMIKDKNKISLSDLKDKAKDWHKLVNGLESRESQYSFIKPKVFIEEYLGDKLLDYRFWCFNGEPKFLAVNTSDGYGMGPLKYFDLSFNEIDLINGEHYDDKLKFNKPLNFDKMIEYAKILSLDHKFVRVDFFNICGKIYVSELTFTPGGYTFKFFNRKNESLDEKIGEMLVL